MQSGRPVSTLKSHSVNISEWQHIYGKLTFGTIDLTICDDAYSISITRLHYSLTGSINPLTITQKLRKPVRHLQRKSATYFSYNAKMINKASSLRHIIYVRTTCAWGTLLTGGQRRTPNTT